MPSAAVLERRTRAVESALETPDARLTRLGMTSACPFTGRRVVLRSQGDRAEVQQRLGHSTVQAAMRYQGVALGRDAALAARLSALA